MALNLFTRPKSAAERSGQQRKTKESPFVPVDETAPEFNPAPPETLEEDPVKRLYQQERYNILLREEKEWRSHPDAAESIETAQRELEEHMALVPAGSVSITLTLSSQPGAPEEDAAVDPFLLDVHTVTNARFQKFVDAGGYDELEYWPEEIWPHLIELKDLTGCPGPRYWRQSRHNTHLADHPVVGVSWYEAQAYALWIGQRLPTEAEWQMAASWHINSSADLMRRFPWGDAMDRTRCNIWASRHRGTLSVTECPTGAAPNQVLQLVGNVWEWTDTEHNTADDENRPIVGEMPMHVVRGGAFDTYFETQASSQFRTGQIALARTYNTGFRCAMDLSDARWINGE
ncbi:MAG: SUMF1/EgtB/PvdO family nonheme iron enzyme [Phycisphaerales bacterium]|nr:MAG: SUMF1/EgtB/PvdO family nonheme iron enzyme [Phycisphaerales bacterium]